MIYIEINPKLKIKLEPGIIIGASEIALGEDLAGTENDLSVVISDDEQIRTLNKHFRTIDAETDVLSFPSTEIDPDTGHNYLGDVIISYPQALKQAIMAGHPVENELQLLTIHGVLHLIGFDHTNNDEKDKMWREQEAALSKLGIIGIKINDDQE